MIFQFTLGLAIVCGVATLLSYVDGLLERRDRRRRIARAHQPRPFDRERDGADA